MKALVIYESMFGNTERIARAIADGLRPTLDVTLADVSGMPAADGMDLVVIGGPTHAFGMSLPATREDAARRGAVRPQAVKVGIREWLAGSPMPAGIAAAAFDTTVNTAFMTGSAARKAHRQLRRLGCRTPVRPQSFRVTGTAGPLVTDEEQQARRWGATLATEMTGSRHPV